MPLRRYILQTELSVAETRSVPCSGGGKEGGGGGGVGAAGSWGGGGGAEGWRRKERVCTVVSLCGS